MKKKLQRALCAALLLVCITANTFSTYAATEETVIASISENTLKARSVLNSTSAMPVHYYPYETFWGGSGIMYIEDDDSNPDSLGKRRLVYCLEWGKHTPSGNLTANGWQNQKVLYAMYFGSMYWGETCWYAPYSTGDWQLDYTATQAAIWVLTGQFTLDYACNYIIDCCNGPATREQRQLVEAACTKLVNGANNTVTFGNWTTNGWMDLSISSAVNFDVTGYEDIWTDHSDGYYCSGGTFHTIFNTYTGRDMRHQITDLNITVPDGVEIRKSDETTVSDFSLCIEESQYLEWQETGKDIPVTVTVTLPRLWGAGIYLPSDTSYQSVTLITPISKSDTVTFTKTITLHIPQVTPVPEPEPEPTPEPTPEPEHDLTIHKVIHESDIWWAHGEPTFLFEVTGTGTDGQTHTYHRAVTYTKEYVESHTDADGTIKLSTTIEDIPDGTYQLTEQQVSRFALTDVTAQTDNISVTKKQTGSSYEGINPITALVTADLSDSDGEVTFYNRKITWDNYSHKDVEINVFPLDLS